ncbi:hypothetical protein [Marilutibacter chinensis]|uniref:Uncharacterized protein n=1 Tax=Marilutibacter chinensis TaxID=2912247 RepID=A0ABS9HUP5_9GAMM|nr:hypothetical protein [Lysobacter chinensis]MCF7222090.1 hypothetical protein [Lysobacter chinensis]
MSANKPNPSAIDVDGLPFRPGPGCPEPVSPRVAGLQTRFPGARSSFSTLGVTHARLLPGMALALGHAHAREKEFAHVPEGHPVPVDRRRRVDRGGADMVRPEAGGCRGDDAVDHPTMISPRAKRMAGRAVSARTDNPTERAGARFRSRR